MSEEREFEVEIASTGQVFVIPPENSILQVLEANDIEVESLCTEGVCGTCITTVLEGVPDHRDFVLDNDERAANNQMTICCSRSHSDRLKLDL